jgi:hypothetical protein
MKYGKIENLPHLTVFFYIVMYLFNFDNYNCPVKKVG